MASDGKSIHSMAAAKVYALSVLESKSQRKIRIYKMTQRGESSGLCSFQFPAFIFFNYNFNALTFLQSLCIHAAFKDVPDFFVYAQKMTFCFLFSFRRRDLQGADPYEAEGEVHEGEDSGHRDQS